MKNIIIFYLHNPALYESTRFTDNRLDTEKTKDRFQPEAACGLVVNPGN
ncbi:hypothetical protein ABNC51_04385 [Paenibacillus larvae]|nr:hypothetical protein [Paenibacillus larvae]